MREFNVTGLCMPEEDYMVDISDKIKKIKELVDSRRYFTINRARQYGKTTTLAMLARALAKEYTCISLSFQGMGETMFLSPELFCQRFLFHISKALEKTDKDFAALWIDTSVTDFGLLGLHVGKLCEDRKIVLMIDEVDKTSNNAVFLHFLDMLRAKFLARKENADSTFHSVILAGVYDIKNIKMKLTGEGLLSPETSGNKIYTRERKHLQFLACLFTVMLHGKTLKGNKHSCGFSAPPDGKNPARYYCKSLRPRVYNSPWNIAADFDVVV